MKCRRRRYATLLLLLLAVALNSLAQVELKGRVVDAATGEPLPYARVGVEGKGATLTNVDGDFRLMAEPAATLYFSYVGYQKMEMPVANLKDVVKLKPMRRELREVTVKATKINDVIKRVIKQLSADYSKYKDRRELYFYRTILSDGENAQMVEAFMKGNSVLHLHHLSTVSGIKGVDEEGLETLVPIRSTNIHYLAEVATQTHNTVRWDKCLKPFESERTTKKNYRIRWDYLTDDNGENIIKLDFELISRKRILPTYTGEMEGTAYVSAKDCRLLRFDGRVLNMKMQSGLSVVPMHFSFCMDYDYSQGYAEVGNIAIEGGGRFSKNYLSKLDSLSYRTLLFHVSDSTVNQDSEHIVGSELMSSIQAAGYDSDLWDKYEVIRRTEEEERLAFGEHVAARNKRRRLKMDEYRPHIDSTNNARLTGLLKRKTAFAMNIPQEKLYVHMDNTCYFLNDTIWFSAFSLQTGKDQPSNMSNVLYVELLNDDGYLVERKLIYMENGHGHGYFALDKPVMYSGFYELRAYTRWQLNWGVKEHFHSERSSEWFIGKELERNFFRDYEKLYSRVFPVYDKPKEPGQYERHMTIRPMRRPSYRKANRELTLSLFPEGGNLVEGLPCRVAYECAWSDGEAYTGEIALTHNLTPTMNGRSERPDSRGRGMFTIVPTANVNGTVTLVTEDGTKVKTPLPSVMPSGATICVEPDSSTWRITSHISPDLLPDSLGLSISHEGKVYAFFAYQPKNQDGDTLSYAFHFTPPKDVSGVYQATIFTESGHVLADRLFFIKAQQQYLPSLTVTGLKQEYQPLERIELIIQSTDSVSIRGGLTSVAVRDARYGANTFDNGTIMTEMLLSSEVRGFVPNPGWFFEEDDQERRLSLDLLMMTQGWRRFDWRQMAVRGEWEPTQPREERPVIQGRVYRQPDTEAYVSSDGVDLLPKWEVNFIESLENAITIKDSEHEAWLKGLKVKDDKLASNIEKNAREYRPGFVETDNSYLTKDDNWYDHRQWVKERARKLNIDTLAYEFILHSMLEDDNGRTPIRDFKTNDGGRFAISIPNFYGSCYLYLGATPAKEYERGVEYEWKEMRDERFLTTKELKMYEIEPNKNTVLVDHPYPRYVTPYSHYQTQVMPSKWRSDDDYLPDEDVTVMAELPVKGRFRGQYAFSDAYPVFMIDDLDADNMYKDAGMYYAPNAKAKVLLGEMGLEMWPGEERSGGREWEPKHGMKFDAMETTPYQPVKFRLGILPTRRLVTLGEEVPEDSIYHRKYLRSLTPESYLEKSEREAYSLMGGIEKCVFYTDYSPRLEGDKRYKKDFPDIHIVNYPYPSGGQRQVYTDRFIRIQGFDIPAEYYNPDYSKHSLPEGQKDYRRTLYWNPFLPLDKDGEAHISFYNNSQATHIEVEAEGHSRDGKLLWNVVP